MMERNDYENAELVLHFICKTHCIAHVEVNPRIRYFWNTVLPGGPGQRGKERSPRTPQRPCVPSLGSHLNSLWEWF